MRIKLNKSDLDKLTILLETKEENIAIASMMNDLCFSLDKFDYIYEIDHNDKETFNKRTIEEILDYFELDENNPDNIAIISRHLEDAFSYIDLTKYNEDSYKKNVNPQEITSNGYKLHYLNYPGGSFFPLDDIKVNEKDNYGETSLIGISKEGYRYLTLSKNNNIWMCITPNEIETMAPHILKAKGNVITFGLGLGYYAYKVAEKKEVRSVTIIERDKEIISLFKKYLLPLFPHKDKITIIEEDAFNYIKKDGLRDYDYAFFDLWHNAEDGLPMYLKIKELKIIPPTGYWIEESLICMYRRCLLTVIEESLAGYSDDDYRRNRNAIEGVINKIYFLTKNMRFESFDEIYRFLSKDNILKMIAK